MIWRRPPFILPMTIRPTPGISAFSSSARMQEPVAPSPRPPYSLGMAAPVYPFSPDLPIDIIGKLSGPPRHRVPGRDFLRKHAYFFLKSDMLLCPPGKWFHNENSFRFTFSNNTADGCKDPLIREKRRQTDLSETPIHGESRVSGFRRIHAKIRPLAKPHKRRPGEFL